MIKLQASDDPKSMRLESLMAQLRAHEGKVLSIDRLGDQERIVDGFGNTVWNHRPLVYEESLLLQVLVDICNRRAMR